MEIKVGDKVKMLENIFDDGEDHHPPGYLAKRGEVLIVRAVRGGRSIAVSHEDVTDSAFYVRGDEYELVPPEPSVLQPSQSTVTNK